MDEADQAQRSIEQLEAAAMTRISQRQAAERSTVQHSVNGKVLCVDCSEMVPAARLKVLPFTNRCTSCAEDRETRGRICA